MFPVSKVTPLVVAEFNKELANHPDASLVSYVLQGLEHGFRLGFNHTVQLKSAKKNKASSYQHSGIIDKYLANEVSLGRVAGPFDTPPIPNLHVSSFGVIPKKGQEGKWRLIVDLSSPTGASVNDGINAEDFALQYIKLDQIIGMVSRFGKGALMAKFDVESAYRNIPVSPKDRYLLGLKWRNKFYVDLALPFGLRSAPFIFNSVADLVEWILKTNHSIQDLLHYLDDYITAGPADSRQCEINLNKAIAVCSRLGLPLHPGKCIGPASCLVVLGIEVDSLQQIARLPADKLQSLVQLLKWWAGCRWCNKKQLESLIGHLHHASMVVWPGRTFVRRMIDLLCCFRRNDHPIRLNKEFQLDWYWWQQFVRGWNGVSFWLFRGLGPIIDVEVTSDAAGSVGFGAFWGSEWFNGRWIPRQMQFSIAYKELFPIVIAARVWGGQWRQRSVCFHCDNLAVVSILNSRTSKDPLIMHLLRNLLMSAAYFGFAFCAQHVPGVENKVADALSRFQWQRFRLHAPLANMYPVEIPQSLWEELLPPAQP